ncbi:MAG: hypothetical protein AB4290_00710 [Spirulina sp.]
MQKKIVYSQLKTFLFQLQFTLLPVQGNHLVFQHPESEALIVLPHYEPNDAIARVHWILIHRILIEYGVLDEENIERFLAKIPS